MPSREIDLSIFVFPVQTNGCVAGSPTFARVHDCSRGVDSTRALQPSIESSPESLMYQRVVTLPQQADNVNALARDQKVAHLTALEDANRPGMRDTVRFPFPSPRAPIIYTSKNTSHLSCFSLSSSLQWRNAQRMSGPQTYPPKRNSAEKRV